MALRTGHGTGAGVPRVEVLPVDIEPHLYPLVKALVACPEGKGKRLLHMPPPEDRAELLRRDLGVVGITRAALFVEHGPLQRAIVFHDLRDTGLTHMAVRGDSPILIRWAGGHTDFKTMQGYIARGRTERRRIGEPLPPLPPSLLEASRVRIRFRIILNSALQLPVLTMESGDPNGN
jgi:hypothetical protein